MTHEYDSLFRLNGLLDDIYTTRVKCFPCYTVPHKGATASFYLWYNVKFVRVCETIIEASQIRGRLVTQESEGYFCSRVMEASNFGGAASQGFVLNYA